MSAIQQQRDTERRQEEATMEEKLKEKTEQHSLEETRVWLSSKEEGRGRFVTTCVAFEEN